MTKGDLGAITLDHWKIALVTGFGVALLAIFFSFIPKLDLHLSRWGVAAVALVGTFIADVLNHGSHYSMFWGDEALITAGGAAALSLLLSFTPLDNLAQKLKK
jgi:hypothetical protein